MEYQFHESALVCKWYTIFFETSSSFKFLTSAFFTYVDHDHQKFAHNSLKILSPWSNQSDFPGYFACCWLVNVSEVLFEEAVERY